MRFSQIVGQEEVKKRLRKAVQENRISHAQLFIGPEGNGKFGLALAYAQYINCSQRTDEDSCGICPSCRKYEKLIHPDLHFVFPIIKKGDKATDKICAPFLDDWRKFLLSNPYISYNEWLACLAGEKKQAIIYTEESNEIIKRLGLKSFESDYKVMIIWLPEKMHHNGSNKLLKLIEEPPEKTLFLLVTENEAELLTTIKSRTQLVKVPRIASEDMESVLRDVHNVPPDEMEGIIKLAGGNLIKARQIIDGDEAMDKNLKEFIRFMRCCYRRDFPELIKLIEELVEKSREVQKEFLRYSLRMIRENFMMSSGNSQLVSLLKEEAGFANNFHPYINDTNIVKLNEEFNLAHYHIDRNAYGKIVFLDLAIKTIKLLPKK